MITTRTGSSILIFLVALTHGAGALEAGNKPITEGLRCHSQRLDFMGKALQRYLNAFLAATAELLPERKPFPDEDERSAGKLPARPQARAAKAAKATAGQKKAPKGKGQVFATRGRHDQDAPADGRFSRRDEL